MHNQPISPANAAVFYPYVHIKDHNWLKATLLVYEHLYRMLPVEGEQAPQVLSDDPPFLHEYTAVKLVRPAKLQSPRVYDAQMELWAKLRVDAQRPEFRERFFCARQELFQFREVD